MQRPDATSGRPAVRRRTDKPSGQRRAPGRHGGGGRPRRSPPGKITDEQRERLAALLYRPSEGRRAELHELTRKLESVGADFELIINALTQAQQGSLEGLRLEAARKYIDEREGIRRDFVSLLDRLGRYCERQDELSPDPASAPERLLELARALRAALMDDDAFNTAHGATEIPPHEVAIPYVSAARMVAPVERSEAPVADPHSSGQAWSVRWPGGWQFESARLPWNGSDPELPDFLMPRGSKRPLEWWTREAHESLRDAGVTSRPDRASLLRLVGATRRPPTRRRV